MCPNGGRDTKDCLDSKTWEIETCDAGDICQIKQKVDLNTGKILETDRDCNERRKCRPGCRRSWDGRITCKKCCDDDFCNTELDITDGEKSYLCSTPCSHFTAMLSLPSWISLDEAK